MEKQKKIPKLRFPEFEGVWEKKKLGQIYKFKVTNSFSRADLNYENGFIKNIHYGDIHTQFATLFDIVKEAVPFVNQEINTDRIEEENYCQVGDLIFADASEDYNDIGKCIEIVNLNNEKVLSGLHTLLARPEKSKMASGFAGHLMKSHNVKLQIQREAQGTKVLSITSGRLSQVDLVYPSLSEQQKIASFFTAIDQKISQLKRKKTLLEQYKKGVMQKIFSQEIRFKDDNGQEFPKWEEKKLGNIGKTYNGLIGKSKDDFGHGKPYIQYKQVFDDSRIDITRFDFVRIRDGEKQCRVKYGDVFFTTSSETPDEVGTSSVLLDEVGEVYLNSFCFGYRSSPKVLIPMFSRYLFRNELLRKEINKLSQGSTRYNMSKNELMKTVIELPLFQEQTKIANFLSAIDNKISQTQKQIEKAEVWKKGLMQQMFV